jgi:dethiobiotin synthetase
MIVRELRASGQRVGAYKPVCSGAVQDSSGLHWDDVDRLRSALGWACPDDAICPQRFVAAVAPPLAARQEGRTIDSDRLADGARWWQDRADLLIVEGAGGLLAPVTETESVADLARRLEYPLVIVARCGLGTINHTLLTLEAARNRNLTIAGIVLNQSHPGDDRALAESNSAEIAARGNVSVLGISDWESSGLHRHGCPVTIDWERLAAG